MQAGRSHAVSNVYYSFNQVRRELGTGNALLAALNGALRKMHPRLGLTRYYLVRQTIPINLQCPRSVGNVQVRELHESDEALFHQDRSTEEIARRFRSGGVCLAAFRGSDASPVGFIWLLWGPYTEPTHRCRLIPPADGKSVLDIDIYIRPDARGGMVFMRLWQAANRYLHEREITRTFSRISAFNGRSLRAHQRLGATILGSQYFFDLGPFELLIHRQWPFVIPITARSEAPDVRLPAY